jgi:hypothetical protein
LITIDSINRWAGFALAQHHCIKAHSSCWNTLMANGRKRGPKTAWQNRVAYNRAKCEVRLKPCQIQSLAAADAFASFYGKRLNYFLTIKFSEIEAPLQAFREGTKRLSQWHRHWGGALHWIYVWEATGGFHVHALVHVPRGLWQDFLRATGLAFVGHDVLIKQRSAGPSAMAYLCKGTDWVTHKKLRGPSSIGVKKQGCIVWKRCGSSENIGRKVRERAGFNAKNLKNNCVKTYTQGSHIGERVRQMVNDGKCNVVRASSYVVSQTPISALEAAGAAAHYDAKQARRRTIGHRTRAHGTGHEKAELQ